MSRASKSKVNPDPSRAQGTGEGYLMHAMPHAFHPRHPDMEIGRALEEIQVPPLAFHRVMDRTLLATDGRAGRFWGVNVALSEAQPDTLEPWPSA